MILDKEVTEDLADDFARWMWRCEYAFTTADVDAFFLGYGTTRKQFYDSAYHHGCLIASVTLEDTPEPVGWDRFIKWLTK